MDLRKIQQAELEKSKVKPKMKTWKISLGALLLTTVITTIAVNATDNLGNFSNSILGSVIESTEAELCPSEMSYISSPNGGFCMDKFEASPGNGCVYKNPQNSSETTENLSSSNCKAESVPGVLPWTNVARHQAELACAQSGKYLPSNEDWYRASLGTPDTLRNVQQGLCNLRGNSVKKTGDYAKCISSGGALDMVGNVWEWVGETVFDGEMRGVLLPEEGYVASINISGVPIETSATSSEKSFNDDYFFIDHRGARGMFRGGYWGSETDGGQYAVNIITPPSFTGNAVGFRCAK